MIDMHSKYDNMHKNGMFYALICINNHVIACYQYHSRIKYCDIHLYLYIILSYSFKKIKGNFCEFFVRSSKFFNIHKDLD